MTNAPNCVWLLRGPAPPGTRQPRPFLAAEPHDELAGIGEQVSVTVAAVRADGKFADLAEEM